MKKLIFYLFAGLLFTACGENEDSDKGIQESLPGSQTLISTMDFYFPRNPNEEREFIELSYDKQHRLIRYKETNTDEQGNPSEEILSYEYGDGIVTITSSTDPEYLITVHLNKAGYAVRVEDALDGNSEYTYDEENRLIRYKEGDEQEEYIWKNGNMVESRYMDSEGYHSTTRYTYYNTENKENIDIVTERMGGLPELEFAGLLGIQCKNLVHTETSDYDAAYKDNYKWEYDLNADGYVTKAVALQPDETGTDDNPRTVEIQHTLVQ